MTRQDLFRYTYPTTSQLGDYNRNYFSADPWRNDPRSNPGLLPATADDQAMAYEQQASELARQANMQGRANSAKQQVQLLQRMLMQPYSLNTAGAPRTPEEAQMQQIVQQNVNQRQAGVGLMVTLQKERERQFQQNLANQLRARQQALAEADFQRKASEGQSKIGQGDDRIALQQQALQRKADNDAARQYASDVQDAQDALYNGVPLLDVFQAYPHLDPQTRRQLMAHAQALTNQMQQDYAPAVDLRQSQNAALDQAELDARNRYTESLNPKGLWSYFQSAKPYDQAAADAAAAVAHDKYLANFQKDKALRKNLYYDPETDTFGALAPEPQDLVGDPNVLRNFLLNQRRTVAVGLPQIQPAPKQQGQLPVITQRDQLANLEYGQRYVDEYGNIRQHLPKGVMFGR